MSPPPPDCGLADKDRPIGSAAVVPNPQSAIPNSQSVLTVTPNTGLDRVLFLDRLEPGRNQARVVWGIGGKGCDVSLILRGLDVATVAAGFAAGDLGHRMEAMLAAVGIPTVLAVGRADGVYHSDLEVGARLLVDEADADEANAALKRRRANEQGSR